MKAFAIALALCEASVYAFVPSPTKFAEKRSVDVKIPLIVTPKIFPSTTFGKIDNNNDHGRFQTQLYDKNDDDWDEDDEEEEMADLSLSDKDWRAFRAQLVKGESAAAAAPSKTSSSSSASSSSSTRESEIYKEDGDLDGIGALFSSSSSSSSSDPMTTTEQQQSETTLFESMTPLDPSQWAYDSGKMIEQGAVILGGVEQDYGFGLRQQYFHKAAILVLDHEESTFTKGIILNRPTDLTLDDDINKGVKWRVWFGGDVQGWTSDRPDIVCLHSLQDEQATRASIPVMKDIQWTSFDAAKRLVKTGVAKPTDFWVFCGYAGWGPGQLMGELDRKSWYMVATDSQTLLKELGRQAAGSDPREAGLDTWTLLMNMIGRSDTAIQHTGYFDDLMLKEWALKNLLSKAAGGGADEIGDLNEKSTGFGIPQLNRLSKMSDDLDLEPGALLRASPNDRSPFLLDDQELHKSVVLILSNDKNLCVGVVLNRPAARGLDISRRDGFKSETIKLPLRFGGQFAVKGSDPLLWLHCHPLLKAKRVGSPVGKSERGIWKCTSNDVKLAVEKGLATPEEFMVISGVSTWTKDLGALFPGMRETMKSSEFEIVSEAKIQAVWDELLKQDVLTKSNLEANIDIANRGWQLGANGKEKTNGKDTSTPIGGLGDGFDEEDDTLVFKSNVKVSKLSDDALRRWIATFLLGSPDAC